MPLPAILGDKTHVEQLLQNLIGNAVKYRRQDTPRVHIAARESGMERLFSVADNGQGIPPQYQAKFLSYLSGSIASSIPAVESDWPPARDWWSVTAAGSGSSLNSAKGRRFFHLARHG